MDAALRELERRFQASKDPAAKSTKKAAKTDRRPLY
jgi:hypothetical protein